VAVPCLRGFGHSSAPMGVKNYSAIEVGADIVGLVQALGHSECIAVAHDWGALQCWHHAILYPDVIKALFIVSIPCWEGCPRIGPGSTMDPLSFARQLYRTGEEDEAFWYLNYHNYDYVHTIGRPEDEYDGDPEMVFRKMIGLSLCLSSLSSVQAAYCRTNSRGISPENAKTILIV
jgi:pimeloyl-ACP methyl ester carboxylesterase